MNYTSLFINNINSSLKFVNYRQTDRQYKGSYLLILIDLFVPRSYGFRCLGLHIFIQIKKNILVYINAVKF